MKRDAAREVLDHGKALLGRLREGLGRLGALRGRASGLPVLSLGLAAVLLVVLLAVEVGFAGRQRRAREEILAAVGFAIEHPAVEVDARLVPAVRALMPSFESNETFAFLRDDESHADQEENDAITLAALAHVDSHPRRALGLVPARPAAIGLVAHPLVHAGWLHALAAIALLLVLSPLLERTWGAGPLAGVLLLATLLGAAAFVFAHRGSEQPLVGAGTWVSALAAAAVVRFRGCDVDLLYWLPLQTALRTPFWTIAPAWLAYELIGPAVIGGGLPLGFDPAPGWAADGVALAVGALAAVGMERGGLEARWGGEPPVLAPRRGGRFDLEHVRRLRTRGRLDQAWSLLQAEAARSARNRDAVVTFFQMAVERGEVEKAAPAVRKLIQEELRRGAGEIAVAHWRGLGEHLAPTGVEPDTLLKLVPVLRDEGDDVLASLALREAADGEPEPGQAARIAALALDLEPDLAAALAPRALESANLPADARARLESLVTRGGSADLEGDDEPPVIEKKPPPPNVFYQEQDRSLFGAGQGELMSPGDEDRLYTRTPSGGMAAVSPPDVTEAVPERLLDDALVVVVQGRGRARIPFAHLHAVALAGVHGLAPRPVVLIDLVVTGRPPGGRPRRVVRLRSDRFDPRPLAPEASSALAALRDFALALTGRAGAEALPASAGSGRLATFDSLAAYEGEVLAGAL